MQAVFTAADLLPAGSREPAAVPGIIAHWVSQLRQGPPTPQPQSWAGLQDQPGAAPGAARGALASAPLQEQIVSHFAHLFECRSVTGVLPRMNQV